MLVDQQQKRQGHVRRTDLYLMVCGQHWYALHQNLKWPITLLNQINVCTT